MRDYKTNLIMLLIFVVLLGMGFGALEFKELKKIERERKKQEEIQRLEEIAEERREKIVASLDKYIEKLKNDKNHEDEIIGDIAYYEIRDLDYLEHIRNVINTCEIYYVGSFDGICVRLKERIKLNDVYLEYGSYGEGCLISIGEEYIYSDSKSFEELPYLLDQKIKKAKEAKKQKLEDKE